MWLPEHLVFTRAMSRSPHPGEEHPPVPPDTPIYDAFAYLGYLAARTERVRLGTHVYNIGLRHPFTAARGVQTVDILSNGRFEFGIGASWLEEEWRATELDFATPGPPRRRGDRGVQARCSPTRRSRITASSSRSTRSCSNRSRCSGRGRRSSIGGESKAALRRAARLGDGWLGMGHTFESAAAQIETLTKLRAQYDRPATDPEFQIVVGGPVGSKADVTRWEDLGVTRMIVSPWRRSKEAIDGLRRFADLAF